MNFGVCGSRQTILPQLAFESCMRGRPAINGGHRRCPDLSLGGDHFSTNCNLSITEARSPWIRARGFSRCSCRNCRPSCFVPNDRVSINCEHEFNGAKHVTWTNRCGCVRACRVARGRQRSIPGYVDDTSYAFGICGSMPMTSRPYCCRRQKYLDFISATSCGSTYLLPGPSFSR